MSDVAKYTLELNWKAFNINLAMVKAHIESIGGAEFCGTSAGSILSIHFNNDPGQSVKDLIQSYWDGILADSAEATGYQSAASIAAAELSAKASGISKLKALGLSDSEVAALVG